MKKTIMLLAALFCAAVCSAKTEIVSQSEIACGDKKIVLGTDGVLSIANAAGEIANVSLQYVFKDSAGNTDWFTVTPKLCKMRRDGDKIVWELWKQYKQTTWKVADQTLELLPDGQLKLSAKVFNPEGGELTPRTAFGSFFILFPVAGNEGKKLIFNDEERTLSPDMKNISAWRGKRFDFTIFPDNPAEKVAFKNLTGLTVTTLISFKKHRITYTFQKDNTCSILIDLSK